MDIYNDYLRFKNKTNTEHIDFKNISAKKTQLKTSKNLIIKQLLNENVQQHKPLKKVTENPSILTSLDINANSPAVIKKKNIEIDKATNLPSTLFSPRIQVNSQHDITIQSIEKNQVNSNKKVTLQELLKRIASCQ